MANVIDIIVSKQAQAELDKVIASLRTTHDEIIKINQQGLKINSGTSPKNPQQMNTSVKETIALNEKLEATNNKLIVTAKKMEQQSIKESNARNSLNNQREKSINQLAKEEAKLNKLNNYYNKTQQQLNTIQQAYNNLAVKKERYNNLTIFEENRLKTLQLLTEKYNGTLKNVDATIGKHTRNVGNYTSGFNPLNNSIAQLGREMPAFANSVQTGFMAISNNLPIFFDAMQGVISQNKELQAQGKPTTSALMQLATAFFSFQTLLSVGVTLLTVYGKEIVNFISGSENKKKAIEAEKKAIEEKQKAEDEAFNTTASYQADEITRSKILFENAKNLSLSYGERLKAVTELKNRYPDYLKHLSNEQILAGQTADAEERLNTALIGRGYALAAQQLLQKNIEKEISLSLKNAKNEAASLVDFQNDMKNNSRGIVINTDRAVRAQQQQEDLKKQSRRTQSDAYREQVKQLRDEREAIMLQYNTYSKYLGVVNETTDSKTKLKKVNEELAKFGTEEWLQNEISRLEEVRSKTETTAKGYREIGGGIAYYTKWLETLTGTQKKSNEEVAKTLKYGTIEYYENLQSELRKTQQAQVDNNQEFAKIESQIKFYQELIDAIKGTSDATKELSKEQNDYFESFIDTFSSNSGFGKMLDILRGNIKDFGKDAKTTALAISEAFQEAFNTISASSQANFDAEYNRLEMQKNVSLQFAGESATAKEEIERQYSDKKREIARREAEAQKKLAIFNIAIDTAQAVVAALPNIPLSIVMGVLGAAQIAMVNSQQIPEFWKGTENAPEGLAWTQEKGAEVITDKKGNVKTMGNNKGPQLTYLEKGDKVYKSQQDYINKTLVGAGIQPIRERNSLTTNDFNNGISKLAKTMQGNTGSETKVYLNNKQINTDYFKGKNV